jgi:hypothetical protein
MTGISSYLSLYSNSENVVQGGLKAKGPAAGLSLFYLFTFFKYSRLTITNMPTIFAT